MVMFIISMGIYMLLVEMKKTFVNDMIVMETNGNKLLKAIMMSVKLMNLMDGLNYSVLEYHKSYQYDKFNFEFLIKMLVSLLK